MTKLKIVIPLGRWHRCEPVMRQRVLRTFKSPIVLTEEGWTYLGDLITHCPWCGDELPRPNYNVARLDASPW
jgi:hypothetical protein